METTTAEMPVAKRNRMSCSFGMDPTESPSPSFGTIAAVSREHGKPLADLHHPTPSEPGWPGQSERSEHAPGAATPACSPSGGLLSRLLPDSVPTSVAESRYESRDERH